AAEGKLCGDRLLDASLNALARDFAQFRAGWFSRFHETLKPTLEERVKRADRYLHLLASKIPPTVSFALNALTILEKAGKLPARAVIEHVGPALFARQKGTVLAALKLLERAVQAEPGLKAEAAGQAAQALAHESADVQGAALDIIQKYGDPDDKELAALLKEQSAHLAASQKNRLATWLGNAPQKPAAKKGKENQPEIQ